MASRSRSRKWVAWTRGPSGGGGDRPPPAGGEEEVGGAGVPPFGRLGPRLAHGAAAQDPGGAQVEGDAQAGPVVEVAEEAVDDEPDPRRVHADLAAGDSGLGKGQDAEAVLFHIQQRAAHVGG